MNNKTLYEKTEFIESVLLKQELEKRLPTCTDTIESKRFLNLINKLDIDIDNYLDDILIEYDK